MADPGDPCARPIGPAWPARQMHRIHRYLERAANPFDQRQVRQARDEVAIGSGSRIGFSALDRLVRKRGVMCVRWRFQEQIGACVDEESVANTGAQGCDAIGLSAIA